MRRAAILTLIALLSCGVVYAQKPILFHRAPDTTAPTLVSAVLASNGTTLTVTFSEAVRGTSATGFTFTPSGAAATLTYASGNLTTALVFTVSRPLLSDETATLAYSSTTGDIADIPANDLATFSATAITNNSTQTAGVEPILSHPSALLIADEGSISFTPTATQGTGITYSATGLPTGASINSSTGAITGTLSTPGKWTTVITATNSYGTDKIWLPVSVYASTANISQSSGFPYYCNTADRKYTLTEDITANGTAIAIIASNVSIDLNGHTITYNNATPRSISNASFETGSGGAATGWDFTNAANAARYAGTYLLNQVYDGSYSLKFSTTTGNEYVDSSGTVTLEANTTYSLSAMFEYGANGDSNPGVTAYVQLRGTGGEATREVSLSTGNNRGIQHKEYVFTTGGSAETYTVRVGITGHASSTKPVYVDDIKVQRTRTYGIATQVRNYNTENYTDISTLGTGTNATITNGVITQGSDGATWGHGVFMHEIGGVSIHDVDVTVNGANASAIYALNQSATTCSVGNCTLTGNTRTITSRDAYDGCVLKGVWGAITNNSIANGCHAGIGYITDTTVCDNTIQLKSKYTNGFAIFTSAGCDVYGNSILCHTGEYVARGILAGGTLAKPTIVHDNLVKVQSKGDIQEYGGTQINGSYGIQSDTSGYVTTYDNIVYAYANAGYDAHCLRYTEMNSPCEAYGNTLYAISDGTGGHASLVSFSESDGTELNLHDNVCYTNDGIVGASDVTLDVTLTDFTVIAADIIADELCYSCYDYPSSGRGLHVTVTFTGTTWGAGTLSYATDSVPQYVPRFGGGDASARMEITIE